MIPTNHFTQVIPKTCVMRAIKITGMGQLKGIYDFLKKAGCESYPDEAQCAGQIWVFDPDTKECTAYTEEEFWDTFEKRHIG